MSPDARPGHILATYKYPYNMRSRYHAALYQLIVGVEQRHPQDNLDAYAKTLRELAKKAFITYEIVEDAPSVSDEVLRGS